MSEHELDMERKILRILKTRFRGEGGEEFQKRAHRLAESLLEMGLLQEAKKAFERFLKINPSDKAARSALTEIREFLN